MPAFEERYLFCQLWQSLAGCDGDRFANHEQRGPDVGVVLQLFVSWDDKKVFQINYLINFWMLFKFQWYHAASETPLMFILITDYLTELC